MKNALDFKALFCCWRPLDFTNCFVALYVHLEGIGDEIANKCGNKICGACATNEFFDTMCGRNALRCRFDGEPTEMHKWIGETEADRSCNDETVDFTFGFAGYEYRKLCEPSAFKDAIVAAIDEGRPVVAKVMAGEGRFRVVTGYDGDMLLEPDYKHVKKPPKKAVRYGELEALYIIGDKITPRYTLKDSLERIVKVMEYNSRERLWDGYIEKLGKRPSDDKDCMEKADTQEQQARMKRLSKTMWATFNTHGFAGVFRKPNTEELRNPALQALWEPIGRLYGQSCDMCWALIDLEKDVGWKRKNWQYSWIVQLVLERLRQHDEQVLDLIKQAIAILEQ